VGHGLGAGVMVVGCSCSCTSSIVELPLEALAMSITKGNSRGENDELVQIMIVIGL
jgi:hypothetical protein